MKSGWVLAYGILIGLLVGGVLFLLGKPHRGQPIHLEPISTPGPIFVQITGEIVHPGVYSLPVNSRVKDLVESAGGLTDQADDGKINLVALLADSQKVNIPSKPLPTSNESAVESKVEQANVAFPIDINSATQVELESLPGIGPKTAQAIIAYREENGFFKTVEDLIKVPNIGPVTLSKLRDLVTANP